MRKENTQGPEYLLSDPVTCGERPGALHAMHKALPGYPYVAQDDRMIIDRLLTQLWRTIEPPSTHLLAYAPNRSHADEMRSYADYVGGLLNASLDYAPENTTLDTLTEEAGYGYDLIMLGRPDESLIEHLFSGAGAGRTVNRLPVSLLIAHQPRRPLRKLLLVIQGDASDHKATDWALRLAGPSGASVTVLAVVPPVPAMYHDLAWMESGLAELLTTDTRLGHRMRQMARRLVNDEIEGTLRLRQGSPNWEIRREAIEGRYDLIAVAAAPQEGLGRWLLGDLATSLLHIVDRPLLMAR